MGAVVAPDPELGVDRDRVVDTQPLDRGGDGLGGRVKGKRGEWTPIVVSPCGR